MPRGPGQEVEQGDQDMEHEGQGFRAQPKPAGEQGFRAPPKPTPPVYQGGQHLQGDQLGSVPVQAGANLSPGGHTAEWFTGDGNWDKENRWEETQQGEAWGSVAQGRWGSSSARDPWADTQAQVEQSKTVNCSDSLDLA